VNQLRPSHWFAVTFSIRDPVGELLEAFFGGDSRPSVRMDWEARPETFLDSLD
jgi:hypothetical protein